MKQKKNTRLLILNGRTFEVEVEVAKLINYFYKFYGFLVGDSVFNIQHGRIGKVMNIYDSIDSIPFDKIKLSLEQYLDILRKHYTIEEFHKNMPWLNVEYNNGDNILLPLVYFRANIDSKSKHHLNLNNFLIFSEEDGHSISDD